MSWYQWVHFAVTGVAVGIWGVVGLVAFDEVVQKSRETARRIRRDRELEEAGVNLRLAELAELRTENRELRTRVRNYEKGKNIFGQISP